MVSPPIIIVNVLGLHLLIYFDISARNVMLTTLPPMKMTMNMILNYYGMTITRQKEVTMSPIQNES